MLLAIAGCERVLGLSGLDDWSPDAASDATLPANSNRDAAPDSHPRPDAAPGDAGLVADVRWTEDTGTEPGSEGGSEGGMDASKVDGAPGGDAPDESDDAPGESSVPDASAPDVMVSEAGCGQGCGCGCSPVTSFCHANSQVAQAVNFCEPTPLACGASYDCACLLANVADPCDGGHRSCGPQNGLIWLLETDCPLVGAE
jgi:hypothetical protein